MDRHLFGLKRMLREGERVPEIYSDPAFARTSHWELSTSQLSSAYFDGWGYGEGAWTFDARFFFCLCCYLLSALSVLVSRQMG